MASGTDKSCPLLLLGHSQSSKALLWASMTLLCTHSPHKSHFNPLKLGLNPEYWAWQRPMLFLKPACSCHLATLKLLSILPFWFLHFCHSWWTDHPASWRVKLEICNICDFFIICDYPSQGQRCTPSPPRSQSSTNTQLPPPTQHPEFIYAVTSYPHHLQDHQVLWQELSKMLPKLDIARALLQGAQQCGFVSNGAPSMADAACTHGHTPQALD